MQKNTYKLLTEKFKIAAPVLDTVIAAEGQIKDIFESLDDTMAYNQYKILQA